MFTFIVITIVILHDLMAFRYDFLDQFIFNENLYFVLFAEMKHWMYWDAQRARTRLEVQTGGLFRVTE